MFNKRDRIFVTNVDPNTLMQALQGTLAQMGVQQAAPTGPGYLGVGAPLSYGVIPKIGLNVFPAQGGHVVDVDVRSDFDQSSIIVAILLLVFFWPLALILGYMAHQGFEQHAQYVIGSLRNATAPYAAAPPAGPIPYPPPY